MLANSYYLNISHTHTYTYIYEIQYYTGCIYYLSFHRREVRKPSFREAHYLLRTHKQWKTLDLFTQHLCSFH